MRYLIDSDWLIDAVGGVTLATNTLAALDDGVPGISTIPVGELYDGAATA